jgi:hypothetical protein
MTIRKRMVLPVALALGALGMMVMATAASATHPRPVGATPLRASMVPAYNTCAAPNRTHGPPLAFPSCNPPVQSSTSLTVGTPDANGAGANSVGFVDFDVVVGEPGLPEDSDVNISASVSDVRCKAGVAACGAANTADGADYTGEIAVSTQVRATDHFNGHTGGGGGPDAATVIDIPYPLSPVDVPCAATANTAIGSTCEIVYSANGVVPGAVKDGKRANLEVQQVQVYDGGTDGVNNTDPNTLFEVQGVFVP